MSAKDVERLVSEGAIERVPVDRAAASRDLESATAHLVSVETRAAHDPAGSFALAYEAFRKAVVAHMRATGLRVKSRGGAHYQTGRYARAALDGLGIEEHLRAFEDLRRLRNRSAYEAVPVDERDALEAVTHARAVVVAVGKEIGL
jgi:HEPN domain